uniref:Alpha-1,3-mannosyl-glycoprotein 2-beta-N-acetylglucosaminyltransferase n=1 Tax=Plectus sambesii TaxID=2011161 RepID=A0A914WNW8_9BILA
MVVPRRFLIYAVSVLIIVWTVGFWILTASSLGKGTVNGDMPTVEERANLLQSKIASVEKAIHEQVAENKRLMNLLRVHNGQVNAPQPPSLTTTKAPIPAQNINPAVPDAADDRVAILVFACNRPKAVQSHIDQILRLRPSAERFPIIVSQDCDHQETTNAIKAYGDKLTFIRQPDQSEIKPPPKLKKFVGYYKIARHYGWALNRTFFDFKYKYAILTEDDLDLAVDFFEYFSATKKLLDTDPTLWCVSAWNDNGKGDKIEDNSELLYRTDFFPGLGWMLTDRLWTELAPIWPSSFWDDWLRLPEQRKDRACIRPEVSRTSMSNNGKVGVSKGLYYDKHLRHIRLNDRFVKFSTMDLSYLVKDRYDSDFVRRVYQWPSITQGELRGGKLNNGDPLPPAVRLTYEDKNTYKVTAKEFGLMDDFRAGVPRTAYRGVVPFMFGRTRVYLAPLASWTNYDPKWS